jgi:hypothetical protein
MANYGPSDTQLVVVVGANLGDAEAYIKQLGKRSEITYQPYSLHQASCLKGRRWNRLILTPWVMDEVERAAGVMGSVFTIRAIEQGMFPPAVPTEWPDGV